MTVSTSNALITSSVSFASSTVPPADTEPWVVPVAVGVPAALGLFITLGVLCARRKAQKPAPTPLTPTDTDLPYGDVAEVRKAPSSMYEQPTATLSF